MSQTKQQLKQTLIEFNSEYMFRDLGYGGFYNNKDFMVNGEIVNPTKEDLQSMYDNYIYETLGSDSDIQEMLDEIVEIHETKRETKKAHMTLSNEVEKIMNDIISDIRIESGSNEAKQKAEGEIRYFESKVQSVLKDYMVHFISKWSDDNSIR